MLFGDYWGHFPENNPTPEPIPGLTDIARRTIGEIVISLATACVDGTIRDRRGWNRDDREALENLLENLPTVNPS